MFSSIIFCLFFFLFNDFILEKNDWKGIYFLMHAIHNIAIGYMTYPSIKRILLNDNFENVYHLNSHVGSLVYSLHFYHILRYYQRINTPEKIHHVISLLIVIPLSHIFFTNHDLLSYSLFSTTGFASVIHYMSLFFYKNNLFQLTKKDVLYVGHISNTYIRFPLIISNASFLLQYLLSTFEFLSFSQIFSGYILFAILLWNGYYFRYLVEHSYYKCII